MLPILQPSHLQFTQPVHHIQVGSGRLEHSAKYGHILSRRACLTGKFGTLLSLQVRQFPVQCLA